MVKSPRTWAMQKEFDQIVTLFKKSISGTLSVSEQSELDGLLKDERWKSVYNRLLSDDAVLKRAKEYAAYDYRKAFQGLERQQPKKLVWRRLYLSFSSVAAAALIAWFVWLLPERPEQERAMKQEVLSELVTPGTRSPQIKLADGRVVNIGKDSMRIKEEKGVTMAFHNGGVSYQSDEEVTALVYNELSVPSAGECCLVLDDGTKVWVNAGSKLKYPVRFTGKDRKVFLEGEAYFDVTKGVKPFIVHTARGEVNVLGTSFGVTAYEDDENVYTTLVTGKVRFTGRETIEINPGEQVVAYRSGKLEKRTVNTEEYVGWKNGLYVFSHQRLESIMQTLSRWYDVKVFFQNPGLKEMEFTGNLKRYDRVDVFLKALQRTGELEYKINGNAIVLSGAK